MSLHSARRRRTSVVAATDKDKLIAQMKKEIKELEAKLAKAQKHSGSRATDLSSLRIKLSAAQKENKRLQQTISELSARKPTRRTAVKSTKSPPTSARRNKSAGRTKQPTKISKRSSGTIIHRGRNDDKSSTDSKPASRSTRSGASSRAAPRGMKPPTGRPSPSSRRTAGSGVAKSSSRRALNKPDGMAHPTVRHRPGSGVRPTARNRSKGATELERTQQERDAARAEVQALKEEIVRMAAQLKESLTSTNDDLMVQVEQLQQELETSESARRELELRRHGAADGQSLEVKVMDLEQCLVALQRENDQLKAGKSGEGGSYSSTPLYDNRIEELQQIVLDYQERVETQKKKITQLMRDKPRNQRGGTQRLSDNVANLTYHIFYGATEKDRALEEMQKKVDASQTDAAYVDRIRKKYGKMRDKLVEEWLFVDNITEAL